MAAPAIHLRFQRSFYIRHSFVGGLFLFLCLALMLMLKQLGPLRFFLPPLVFFGPWLFFVLREYRLAAREMDDAGVTRNDRRRFLWTDLHKVLDVYMRLTPGRPGPLNNVDLHFAGGKVRILPMVLENGWEAIQFARKMEAARMGDLRRRIYDLLVRRTRELALKGDRVSAFTHGGHGEAPNRRMAEPGEGGWGGGKGAEWPRKEKRGSGPAWPG